VLTEFDAVRSELFLARAAVLVEGQTEKLVLPFVFGAVGYDADREAVSIVECGGKPNVLPFAPIAEAARACRRTRRRARPGAMRRRSR
jgi:predicted ATP-dependent endonuclease of OLD family